MAKLDPFKNSTLEGVCKLLGDATSGSEITRLLAHRSIPDPGGPSMTKWKRLLLALGDSQRKYSAGNHVVQVTLDVMAPPRFADKGQGAFEQLRSDLNVLLAFEGYALGEDGQLRKAEAATTLSEAEARAGRLRGELGRRHVHDDVLKACRAELLQDNCFHAVLEATKTVTVKIRTRTGLTSDGHRLIDEAFGSSAGKPRLAFNSLLSDSDRNEHGGLMNMMKGVLSAFRNPTAHEPKDDWPIDEGDALDLLSTLSLLHRRLDSARPP